MYWLQKHKTLSIAIILIVILVIVIAASYQLRDKGGVVGSAASSVVSFVQKPIAALGEFLGDSLGKAFSDDELLAENEKLKEENRRLKRSLVLSILDETELNELKSLYEVLRASGIPEDRKMVEANIISYEGSGAYDIFTVDIGTEAGVKRNTVVVSGVGLVGRVLDTGKGWSKIVATIDENNKVGFEIRGTTKTYLGVCSGDGKGNMTGYMLDENAEVKEGELVYTSGVGGIYPSGIIIGNVVSSKLSENNQLLSVKINTVNDFKSLKKVGLLI
jgi:rod shape-determining protein MreC